MGLVSGVVGHLSQGVLGEAGEVLQLGVVEAAGGVRRELGRHGEHLAREGGKGGPPLPSALFPSWER